PRGRQLRPGLPQGQEDPGTARRRRRRPPRARRLGGPLLSRDDERSGSASRCAGGGCPRMAIFPPRGRPPAAQGWPAQPPRDHAMPHRPARRRLLQSALALAALPIAERLSAAEGSNRLVADAAALTAAWAA